MKDSSAYNALGICALLLVSFHLVHAQSTATPPRAGQVIFETRFEGSNALAGWRGKAELQPGFASAQSVCLASSSSSQGAVISRVLPVEQLQGCTLRFAAQVRAESVSAKPNPWNGIKFMLVTEGPSGKTYPQAPLETGTFDWRLASFSARVPADATNLTIVLGLEQVGGKAWFDDLNVAVRKAPRRVSPPTALAGTRYTGHTLARLRGTMISPNIDAASLRVLGTDWNANVLRWQLIRFGRPGVTNALSSYDAWLEGELKRLDAGLPLCRSNGLLVVVDLHSPPGGRPTVSGYVGSDNGLFTDPDAQTKFVETWRRLAARYKGNNTIWGFDLANEPVEDDVGPGCLDWQDLAEKTARAVQEVDPLRTLIVEPADWGGPQGLKEFLPLPLSNVVYSVHMYEPHAFTHQGVHQKGPALSYPGMINGQYWDKAALERALAPAVEFQKRFNVQIYIGEFSAIRWAPDNSACRYLKDLIDIFEARGWDWTYHAFREWSGWSVEHGSDPTDTRPASAPTDRQRLLCDWFSKNQKPK